MKVEYINPFIESVYDLFTTMLGSIAKRGAVGLSRGDSAPSEITALIGLSGPARGVVALSFPVATALAISNRLLGMESRVVDDTAADAIAEVVNIVAGGAKGKFELGDRPPIDLSLPSIVRGKNYHVEYPTCTTWLEVPFESDLGPFNMRVVFEMSTTEAHLGMKALVVDDSLVMRKVLIGALARANITDVHQAADGAKAVAAVQKAEYDLVLMDWNMPNMLGIDAVRAIRALGMKMPIIMVTTEAERSRVVDALKAGATNYIIKPFKPAMIVTRIQEALAKAAP